jgi:hypothetical protein
MKKTPWMVESLLKGMSEASGEYAKGGGSPTGGVVMPGWWRGGKDGETRDYRSVVKAEEKRDATPRRKPW